MTPPIDPRPDQPDEEERRRGDVELPFLPEILPIGRAAEFLGLTTEALSKRFKRRRFPAEALIEDGGTRWVDVALILKHLRALSRGRP